MNTHKWKPELKIACDMHDLTANEKCPFNSEGCKRGGSAGSKRAFFSGKRDWAAGMISMSTKNGIHLWRPRRPKWLEEANGPEAPSD